MKYSVKYKRVFDKENHIIDISSVTPENKMTEYYSIGTRTPMTAALGEKNQHHFRAKRGYTLNPKCIFYDELNGGCEMLERQILKLCVISEVNLFLSNSFL